MTLIIQPRQKQYTTRYGQVEHLMAPEYQHQAAQLTLNRPFSQPGQYKHSETSPTELGLYVRNERVEKVAYHKKNISSSFLDSLVSKLASYKA